VYYPFIEEIAPAFDDYLNDDVRCLLITIQTIFGTSVKVERNLSRSGCNRIKIFYDSPKRSYANDLLDAIDQGDVSQPCFQNQRELAGSIKWTFRQKNNLKF
jgi:phage head maturation protease